MQVFVGFFALWLIVGVTAWFVGLWRDFKFIKGPDHWTDFLAFPIFAVGGPVTWAVRWVMLGRSPFDTTRR